MVCLLCSIDFLWSGGYFVITIYFFRWYYVLNENLHCFSLVAFSFIFKTSIFIVRFSRKHVNKLWILGLNIVTKFLSKSYTFYNSSSTYKPCPAGHDRASVLQPGRVPGTWPGPMPGPGTKLPGRVGCRVEKKISGRVQNFSVPGTRPAISDI